MQTLRDILPQHLITGLTPAEETVLDKAIIGDVADFTTGDTEMDTLDNAGNWGNDRTIRSEFMYWLCTDEGASKLVHAKGIQIKGAKFVGDLDFDSAIIPHPLRVTGCETGDIILRDAETRFLRFSKCITGQIIADRLSTKGSLFLKGTKTTGVVRLLGADIGGTLDCIGAVFENPGGVAFSADGIKVKGTVFLKVKKATGGVRLLGADIGGTLDCIGAVFENPGGVAFSADGIKVKGTVFLKVKKATGEVRLLGADIGGTLDCTSAVFENPGGVAFSADRIKSKGTVFLNMKKTTGDVRLIGADIGGTLDCIGAVFENPGGVAFSADGIKVKGTVFLNMKKAIGEVRLIGADIGGDLDCTGAVLENPGGVAFSADGIKSKGNVLLKVKKVIGEVRLLSAEIYGNLECKGAVFENLGGDALSCENAQIKGALFLNDVNDIKGTLDLMHAKAGVLVDDEAGWPEKGKLEIDGFEYGGLPGAKTPKTAMKRLEWIRRQPDRPFKPRPYEQLAKVFREMGHDADAKAVLIAKHEDKRRFGDLDFWPRWRSWLLGFSLKHGYYPWRVVGFMCAIVYIGIVLFSMAYNGGIMLPSRERVYMDAAYTNRDDFLAKHKEYPSFSAIIYSLDTFLPVVDLHQENYWLPSRDVPYGRYFRWYLWFQIASGWVSTTLLVVYMTGLVRKE
jgi:hypothetical protein